MRSDARIAVIGMGPRGLGALEALAEAAEARSTRFTVDIFDPFPAAGAGPNFDPGEAPVCRLNIPLRDIDIPPPEGATLATFAEWLEPRPDPDSFPPRADLGRYLEARYAALKARPGLAITRYEARVDRVARDAGGWTVTRAGAARGPYREVLLTLGQPPVSPDAQLADWQAHAANSEGVLAEAYPAAHLVAEVGRWQGKTVAIRGLALSAFDVLRVLTLAQGGRFEDGVYIASGREPQRILPFSLNGQPPFPKPETGALDARFEPTAVETARFETAVAEAAVADPDTARRAIAAALQGPITRIMAAHGDGSGPAAVEAWLATEWQSPGLQEPEAPLEALALGIALAEGRVPVTIGYAVGQLWRKWQNQIRAGYNAAPVKPGTARALLGFDEGLKRYSYGPPVTSSRELAALVAAGLVDLDLVCDPEVVEVDAGWRMRSGAASAVASVMIDGVMPPPDPGSVTGPLVSGLMADGLLRPLGEGLAAETAADGSLIGPEGAAEGLCLLGRLALGSVIAADSLHDCFGAASRRWAAGVISRAG